MSKKLIRLIKFLIPVLFVLSVMAYGVMRSLNPHKFSEAECSDCHINHEKDPSFLTSPISVVCKNCHQRIVLQNSHPVDVFSESTEIPADLPLKNMMITCNTCHDIHGEYVNIFGERTYFLRRPYSGRTFCITCHKQGVAFQSHTDSVDVAHLGSRFKVTDPSGSLDPVSLECLNCHSGIIGSYAKFQLGSGIWSHDYADHSHPVGVDYQRSRRERSESWLKPMSTLDERIKFFDGKIGCGTCHDIFRKSNHSLVMTNSGSKLCTACHEL